MVAALLRRVERPLSLPLQRYLTTLIANPDFLPASQLRGSAHEVVLRLHAACPLLVAPVLPYLASELQASRLAHFNVY